jgi:predicted methyltransferase
MRTDFCKPVALLAALLLSGAAAAACTGQHDFDDSFGAWKVHVARLDKPLAGSSRWFEYDGTHTITPIWDGRANVGVLDVTGPAGRIEAMSPRLYDPATCRWNVLYASARDGAMGVAHVGQFSGGKGVFIARDTLAGQAILVRNEYWAESPDVHRFEVAYSKDKGKTWETNWKMTEFRIKEAPSHIANAVDDADRPQADRQLDASRKPLALLAFTGLADGARVVDLMPGNGYFTRLFSKAVGAGGKVFALQPLEMDKAAPDGLRNLHSLAALPAYGNVTVLTTPVSALAVPDKVDMVWTSMNYHDLHVPFMGMPDIASLNRAIFAMLKPGGLYVVMDHAAAPGTGFSQSDALHRIDPATVREEIVAAGFEFVEQTDALRNTADTHAIAAFDPSMRGKTDRFVYKFRRPR